MKIQIASDLHLEAIPSAPRVELRRHAKSGALRVVERGARRPLPLPEAFEPVRGRDVLILAGDIGREALAREFVEAELSISPVIYVPGNHEYYSERSREEIDLEWRWLAGEHRDLHYLVCEGMAIDGVRFWGAPWYSDLWGTTNPWDLATGQHGINDFWEPVNGGGEWTLSRHIEHNRMQTAMLAAQAGEVDVVITHWPPTKGAMHPRFEGDSLSPYFYNDREDLVRAIGAKLWVSGHTHEAYDYEVGPTRCIGNPTGYSGDYRQSPLFRPDRVVEV